MEISFTDRDMKKSDWQYFIDTLLFISIIGIISIGFFMGLVIPKGPSVAESAKYFLRLHRYDWGNLHFYLSIAFTALVFIHLIFSWNWIKGKAKQIFKNAWRTSLLIWNFWPKSAETYADYGHRQRDSAFGSQEGEWYQVTPKEAKAEETEHEDKITRERLAEEEIRERCALIISVLQDKGFSPAGRDEDFPSGAISILAMLPEDLKVDDVAFVEKAPGCLGLLSEINSQCNKKEEKS